MTVRSARLWGPVANVGTGFESVYTVPTGYRAVVKSIRVVNLTAAPTVFDLTVSGSDPSDAFFWQENMPAGAIVLDSSWWVLMEDDEVTVRASVAESITTWASGALLLL